MPVISRSIPAVPYQGGTLQTVQPYSSAVQLTPTRMVWTYCQTNPAWRFFVIVDTPEGYVNGGTPTVTVARMQDQRTYQGNALHMARLNDNAFVLFDLNNVGSGNYTAEVFEITSELEFKKTYYNTSWSSNAYAYNWGSPSVNMRYCNQMAFIPVKDNVLYQAEISYNSGTISGRVLSYDNTKSISASLTATSNAGLGNTANNATSYSVNELTVRPIPGAAATKYSLSWHCNSTTGTASVQAWNAPGTGTYISTTNGNNTFNSTGAVIIDVAPTIANTASLPTVTSPANVGSQWVMVSTTQIPLTGMATPYDSCHMSETRIAYLNWQNAYFYNATNMASQGGGAFAYGTASTNPMMAYPLTADYIMLVDRTHFLSSTSGDLKIKIIRRDDSNFVSVSGGSTAGTGFSVTAPWIDTWRCDPRPRMLPNGDLFWWGLDSTAGNANLTWNILKSAS